jgi:hypothetical protein
MNKTLAVSVLILVLSTASCGPLTAEQPEPLVLPYVLYDQEHCGNQVKITLASACALDLDPGHYCFRIDIHAGEGQTMVGANVITVPLPEGYQPDREVDWAERIGDQEGSGGPWTGTIQPGTDLWHEVAFGLGGQASDPVALFVRVTGTDQGTIVTQMQTSSPLAVLQILPDGGGVVRLDE